MTGEVGGRVRALTARGARAAAEVPRWIWLAVFGVAVLLVAALAMGGFARARVELVHVGPGDEVRTSTFAITVLEARLAQIVEEEYLEAEPGEELLVLTTRMENLSETPIGVGSTADLTKANLVNTDEPLIDLVGVTATDRTAVWRPDGSAGQVFLQPDVPSEVRIAWTVPADALPHAAVSLDIHEADVRRGAVILSSDVVTWDAAEVAARITVPIEESR